jgi:FkbM family methyltransferase
MAGLKDRVKVLLRSGSLHFTRDYFSHSPQPARRIYRWGGLPVHYRSGTSDTRLIYSILLKRGRKSEYALPRACALDPARVRTVLDIGANIGISAVYLASIFPNAEVHAFEPEPGNVALLSENAKAIPRIRVHPFALGAEDGELTLYSSDEAVNFGGFSAHGLGVDASRSQRVPVRHAGRCLAALGVRQVDVIKIDTEGAEWDILTSLGKPLLDAVQLIMGELHGRRDFELLTFLQPAFDIEMKKQLRNRLFNFYAARRSPS